MNRWSNHPLPFRPAQGPECFDRAHHPERVEGLAKGQRIPIRNRDCNRRASGLSRRSRGEGGWPPSLSLGR
jgi:hypothetical protein